LIGDVADRAYLNGLHSGKDNHAVQIYALDVLAMGGDDLRSLPLSQRKASLASSCISVRTHWILIYLAFTFTAIVALVFVSLVALDRVFRMIVGFSPTATTGEVPSVGLPTPLRRIVAAIAAVAIAVVSRPGVRRSRGGTNSNQQA
jgi:hypothetical protein